MKMLSLRFLFAISCGAAALDFACGEIIVDDKLPAGNIVFEKIEGDKVFVDMYSGKLDKVIFTQQIK